MNGCFDALISSKLSSYSDYYPLLVKVFQHSFLLFIPLRARLPLNREAVWCRKEQSKTSTVLESLYVRRGIMPLTCKWVSLSPLSSLSSFSRVAGQPWEAAIETNLPGVGIPSGIEH